MKRLDQLTFFRFIAAIMIVIYHYGKYTYPFDVEPLRRIPYGDPYITSFFFVLSGFVLTYVYASRAESGLRWGEFMVKRLSRFYPLYLVSMIVMVPLVFGRAPDDLAGAGLGVVLLQSWFPQYATTFNGPAWAMSVFFAIYAGFPLVLGWLVRKGTRFALTATAVFWALSQIVIHLLVNLWMPEHLPLAEAFIRRNPIFHLNTVLVGMAFALLYRERMGKARWGQRWNAAAIIAIILGVLCFAYFREDIQQHTAIELMYANGLLAPVYGWLIFCLAWDETRILDLLKRPTLLKLGELSFSIYLLQHPLATLYRTFLLDRLEVLLPYRWTTDLHLYLYLGLLLAVAWLSRTYFERPVERWIRSRLVRLRA